MAGVRPTAGERAEAAPTGKVERAPAAKAKWAPAAIYRFGAFQLDVGARALSHRGRRVSLRRKPFDMLELLASREGQVVTKATLLDVLWSSTAVHENNIAVTARALRKALHQHDPTTEWIETVPGHGYRLAPDGAGGAGVGRARSSGERREGGRGPQCAVTQSARVRQGAFGAEPFVGRDAELFVARDAELEQLDALWAAARRGAGRVVFVSGEPGIGKSTLLARFLSRALGRAPHALAMRGQCIQLFGLAEPHLPFREALADGLSSDAGADLLDALEHHAPGWCARLSPALAGAFARAGEASREQRSRDEPSREERGRDERSREERGRDEPAREERGRDEPGRSEPRTGQPARGEPRSAHPGRSEPWRAHAGALELGEALRAVATIRPVLLLLEDLHWADASSVDVLRWLCGRVHGCAILVLASYRSADVRATRHPFGALHDDLSARGERQELVLGPWQSRDLERYIAARFGSPALGAALAPSIDRRTEGLPLFAVRLVESLLERAIVRRDEHGAWALAAPLETLEIGAPESIAALIERQLGLVPAGSRQLLEVASVDGAEFGALLLSDVLGAHPGDVESGLQQLADTYGLIECLGVDAPAPAAVSLIAAPLAAELSHGWRPRPPDVRYRFRHALYRDHLYGRLGHHRRLSLHLAIARSLLGSPSSVPWPAPMSPASGADAPSPVASPSSRADASSLASRVHAPRADAPSRAAPPWLGVQPLSASRLAFHFERGADASRAVAWWTEAGDAADRAFAKLEALECYERAAALLDDLPPGERALRRLVLEHGRGWAAYGLSRTDAAWHHFSEFARLARELLAAPATAREPALALASEYFERPWADVVMRRPAEIFPRAASVDAGSELLAEALHCCCHAAHADGRDAELYEHARALERVAQASSSGPRRAEALAWLGVHALRAGRAEQARRELDAAIALARHLDHRRALRVALASRAWLHRMQAELEPARGACEELWRWVPDARSSAEVLSELGATLAAGGQAGAALDAYRRADAVRQRIAPGFPSLHGALLRELGQLEAAGELDRAALAQLRGRGDRELLGRLASSLAITSCRGGDRAAARELLQEAQALLAAEPDDCSWRRGPLWAARCEIAAATGDGALLLRQARRWLRSARARVDVEGIARASLWLALAFIRQGDERRALEQLTFSLDATRDHALPLVDWRCQALLACLLERQGDGSAAASARREARHLIDTIAQSLDDRSARHAFEQMAARELGALGAPLARAAEPRAE